MPYSQLILAPESGLWRFMNHSGPEFNPGGYQSQRNPQTVIGWVHRYNADGSEAFAYLRNFGTPLDSEGKRHRWTGQIHYAV